MSRCGDTHTGDWRDHDAWQLDAGDVAIVEEIHPTNGDFKLRGGHGQERNLSCWTRRDIYAYADAETDS